MAYFLEIKEEASDEINDAFHWYESRKTGLGDEFIGLLEEYFNRITSNPLLYQAEKGVHVAVMTRFPYKIVYGIEESSVVIYAVFHTSRNPKDLER